MQWDGLVHIMYENYMSNGYDCRNASSSGAAKVGIEKTAEKKVGCGVLLDAARALGKKHLPGGCAITNEMLDHTEQQQGVKIGRGDHLLLHTGLAALPLTGAVGSPVSLLAIK